MNKFNLKERTKLMHRDWLTGFVPNKFSGGELGKNTPKNSTI